MIHMKRNKLWKFNYTVNYYLINVTFIIVNIENNIAASMFSEVKFFAGENIVKSLKYILKLHFMFT